MAQIMRLPQPWLRNAMPKTPTRVTTGLTVLAGSHAGFATTALMMASRGNSRRGHSKEFEARLREKLVAARIEDSKSILLPMTYVPPPISRYPRSTPSEFLHMMVLHYQNRIASFLSLVGQKFVSQEGVLSRPRFKARKGVCVPTAKALHTQQAEAFAAGDRDTLAKVCCVEMYRKFAEAIDARPLGRRLHWELVKYEKSPKLVDWRTSQLPLNNGTMKVVKQAVVQIASVQRTVQYDKGVRVEGSERERKLVENVVIQCDVNQETWEDTPWRVWGTVPETTYDQILQDKEMMKEVM